jgi:hypothetical protein
MAEKSESKGLGQLNPANSLIMMVANTPGKARITITLCSFSRGSDPTSRPALRRDVAPKSLETFHWTSPAKEACVVETDR